MKFTCRSAILGLVWLSPVLIAAGPHDVQRDIPRDAKSSDAPVLSYPLPLGGALQHAQYAGRLRRVDANGNEMAKAKVPAAKIIASSTLLVLSSDFARVLMLHGADDTVPGFRPPDTVTARPRESGQGRLRRRPLQRQAERCSPRSERRGSGTVEAAAFSIVGAGPHISPSAVS